MITLPLPLTGVGVRIQYIGVIRPISESTGIERLAEIRSAFSIEIRAGYEHKAKPCSSCESPGICCRDEHFVNVHITRLEAVAIGREIAKMDDETRNRVHERSSEAIKRYNLDGPGDSFGKTYACPLFERGTGCLIHATAKPLPCIAHACYEKREDLPPENLLEAAERSVMRLNQMVYGKEPVQTPIPVAVGLPPGTRALARKSFRASHPRAG